MTNNSSTGGYLTPLGAPCPAPLEGTALNAFFQGIVAGVTSILGTLVRPRWQQRPPIPPTITTDWCAVGISSRVGDSFAVEWHASINYDNPDVHYDNPTIHYDMPDFNVVQRGELLTVLCSFYGPNADNNASLLREGLSLAQNREGLQLQNMGYINCSEVTPVPSLTNEQWWYRADMSFTVKRLVTRYYPVLEILSAQGELITDVSPITRTITVTE